MLKKLLGRATQKQKEAIKIGVEAAEKALETSDLKEKDENLPEPTEVKEKKRVRSTEKEKAKEVLEDFIERYGYEGLREIIEGSKDRKDSGIKYNITITKEDLTNTELIKKVAMLEAAMQPQIAPDLGMSEPPGQKLNSVQKAWEQAKRLREQFGIGWSQGQEGQ